MRTEPAERISTSTREERFLALLDEHRKIVFKVAHMYCRNQADFADVVQEIVLQAWRSFGRYDESRRFSTWLYTMALNVTISYFRGEARRSKTLVPADDSIVQIAAPEDQHGLLREFLDELGDVDKALVLLYLDGNSYEVMADVIGISESNVGTRLNRIRQKLRKVHSNGIR